MGEKNENILKQIDLKCGIAVSIDRRVLDDMEFLDCLAEADNEEPAAVSRLVLKLLGTKQRRQLYEALRDDAGFVPSAKVVDAVVEIITAFGDTGKNA